MLDDSIKEYKEIKPAEEAADKEFEAAKKELSKKDGIISELTSIEAEIKKNEDINKINSLVDRLSDEKKNNTEKLSLLSGEK